MLNMTVANDYIACILKQLAIFGSRHGRDKAGSEKLSSLSSRLAECGEEVFSVISAVPWSNECHQSIWLQYAACNWITASDEPVVNSAVIWDCWGRLNTSKIDLMAYGSPHNAFVFIVDKLQAWLSPWMSFIASAAAVLWRGVAYSQWGSVSEGRLDPA